MDLTGFGAMLEMCCLAGVGSFLVAATAVAVNEAIGRRQGLEGLTTGQRYGAFIMFFILAFILFCIILIAIWPPIYVM